MTESQVHIFNKKYGGIVDLKKPNDGIYAFANATPVYRFDMDIIPGHIYERRARLSDISRNQQALAAEIQAKEHEMQTLRNEILETN